MVVLEGEDVDLVDGAAAGEADFEPVRVGARRRVGPPAAGRGIPVRPVQAPAVAVDGGRRRPVRPQRRGGGGRRPVRGERDVDPPPRLQRDEQPSRAVAVLLPRVSEMLCRYARQIKLSVVALKGDS